MTSSPGFAACAGLAGAASAAIKSSMLLAILASTAFTSFEIGFIVSSSLFTLRVLFATFHLQPVVRQSHPLRQFRLGPVVIIIVRQVGEVSAPRADPPRRRQRFIQTHVRRMRLRPQRIEYSDF